VHHRGEAPDRRDRAGDESGAALTILALKLVLTPALIAIATIVGRRWGPSIGGWLVGLPFTSGPVSFFLALEQGAAFAADAGAGFVAGAAAAGVFALAYATGARRAPWPLTLAAASVVYLALALALSFAPLDAGLPTPLAPTFVGTLIVLATAIRLIPVPGMRDVGTTSPRWDLPARMVVATALVVGITAAAPHLGPRLTGLLTTYPIYASVLVAFAHAQRGREAAIGVVRGLCFGLFAFASFFLVLAALLEQAGIAVAFAAAVISALTVQSASLAVLRLAQRRVHRQVDVPLERA
jgi:hypothetical protein